MNETSGTYKISAQDGPKGGTVLERFRREQPAAEYVASLYGVDCKGGPTVRTVGLACLRSKREGPQDVGFARPDGDVYLTITFEPDTIEAGAMSTSDGLGAEPDAEISNEAIGLFVREFSILDGVTNVEIGRAVGRLVI